ncbi:4'-phosphopantetheinyl transferase [Pseudorhizobium tarimense]|uniref:4'-phosphopantetheinyl transferase n=1 Tax=Pseudorhizobium tarimense TaxID=1079109 RepID=A0ABV2H4F8_9HYPH|nr:4'-phosphopantetheinyl transferase superfamily protein [Pseudorhizobium tarimense]MCJ8518623.1 4'-phosphopantetheinyl transferase superfamily protein [Pseudorhizobium tarimense]
MRSDVQPAASIEVDVWTWSLDAPLADCSGLYQVLSDDERVRAERFLRDVDRRRYIVGRAALRRILGAYLGIDAKSICFVYNSWSKPELDLLNDAKLSFNLSHSAAEAILAVSAHAVIGVDIEEIRPIEDDVERHFFSSAECHSLAALPQSERIGGFYRCWTRKEAFVKAHGAGLSVPLDSFDVCLAEKGRRLLKRLDPHIGLLTDWTLLNLDVADGFCGALAIHSKGRNVEIRYRSRLDWSANMASIT